MSQPPAPAADGFRVSESAARRLREILDEQPPAPDGEPALRVAVEAGGCNGFQYKFALDHSVAADDIVIPAGTARVLVDPASLDLLAGAELDFNDSLMGAHFTVRNPNAASSCGCGTSFSVE
ncbi:iron-sulfur cluster assembly accessory protein [Komagataeibacter rhaeticus]|uniref:Iron-sulfur cluster assembly accessory protein n=1 Tax=Komagataeibacter rhaeticus TaxID=215221 RepID=A0A181C820_9PROT|nr:iron-sulfur cluster assembly accessory protein [Komagataeibacter rhaeticus]ATU73535.1 iron-sulfur cluster assembly accessory protein [Komagataeibacter xylinus]KDU95348.1 Fe-S cluster assembly protein HesB [Komagataeibacter rhaeticus AF1]MBL7239976.1 iron-sulfur cluster assembly accessory protein [Komagataeibacter rhaeticus]PYD54024.1 iron-sulfur cluster assembly accessory protein [Komagataeibacter rhaeticus]QIP34633.1 iron-sulfur cluster assembly accessory protein [Komagataeibacter rhaeticu